MLPVEDLVALDLMDWFGRQSVVGDVLECHQSSVSRKFNSARSAFHLNVKSGGCRTDENPWFTLLTMERHVHQHSRFRRRSGLRLHKYRYMDILAGASLPDGWTTNPVNAPLTHQDAMKLVAGSVIDALLAPFPLIKDLRDEEISVFPLFSLPLRLLVSADSPLSMETGLTSADIAAHTLPSALDFIPGKVSQCVLDIDKQIFSSASSTSRDNPRRFWGTFAMSQLDKKLALLDFGLPVAHKEFLVVRKVWREHACIHQLLAHFSQSLLTIANSSDIDQELSIVKYAY